MKQTNSTHGNKVAQTDKDLKLQQLEQRVDQLEAHLEENSSERSVTRRTALQAGAAALLGGSAIGAGIGTAGAEGSLDDGDTQWGSDTNRDDYLVDVLDANSVQTGDTHITHGHDDIETGAINYHWGAQSLDGMDVYKSNAETAQMQGIRLLLSTEATAGSWVQVEDKVFNSWNYSTWGKMRKARVSFWLNDVSQVVRFATGRAHQDDTKTHSRIGCRIENGDLYAEVASDDDGTLTDALMRSGIASGEQYELFVDFDGYDGSGSAQATVRVRQFPATGSTTPNWTETHTFDETAPLPAGKETTNSFAWTAWSASARTPDGVSFDIHLNDAYYYLDTDKR